MWLWKKFWNIDIIGKIYILIILFIVIVATMTIITRYKNISTNQNINEIKEEHIEEASILESNVVNNDVITVANLKKDTKEEQNLKDIVKSNSETKKQEDKSVNKNSTVIPKVSEVKNKTTDTQEKQNKITKENTIDLSNNAKTNTIENKSKQENKENVTTEERMLEKYIINTSIIQKMKEIITNNPSEYMIKYGYTIIDNDNSITEKTNQFTFSELNVKSKINKRFGTIRIFARDYYCNNEYVSTQCFIY